MASSAWTRILLGAGAATVLTAACGRTGPFEGASGGATPTPTPTVPTPTPSPPPPGATPTPGDVGSGAEGARTVSVVEDWTGFCHRIEQTDGDEIELAADPGFAIGDRILLLQMQDEGATSGAPAILGSSMDPGLAGVWQVTTVAGVSGGGTDLQVDPSPIVNFVSSSTRRAQTCRMPEFTNLTIDGTLQAEPWDGDRGGVIAFFASGTVAVNGSLSVARRGFRGGDPGTNVDTAFNTTDLDTNADDGYQKGEGLDGRSFALFGRGNYWNGGGGGNGHNAGGGGGGGGGAGGFGGTQQTDGGANPLLSPNTRGMPGSPVWGGARLLTFGGGGGSGHGNSDTAGGGGAGGGIVLVFATTISGSGSIAAVGNPGASTTGAGGGADGAGGGGAGGTVLLRVSDASSALTGTVEARGGEGGDSDDRGPGGGGGGGRILLEGFGTLPATDVAGGGQGTEPGNDIVAEPGAAGTVE